MDKPERQILWDYLGRAKYLIENGYPVHIFDVYDLAVWLMENSTDAGDYSLHPILDLPIKKEEE